MGHCIDEVGEGEGEGELGFDSISRDRSNDLSRDTWLPARLPQVRGR